MLRREREPGRCYSVGIVTSEAHKRLGTAGFCLVSLHHSSVRVVRGPLVDVTLDRALVASVLPCRDPHPVTPAPHPCLHAPDDTERSRCCGRTGCQTCLHFLIHLLSILEEPRTDECDMTTMFHLRQAGFGRITAYMSEHMANSYYYIPETDRIY